jgi:hypothetical protein
MAWAFEGGLNVTALPAGSPLVTAPNLATRFGVPPLFYFLPGLELGANVMPFVLSPSPPAFATGFSGYVMQRLVPWPRWPVSPEESSAFELALRLQLGGEQVLPDLTFPGLQFAISGSLPLVYRVAHALRVELAPSLGYYAGVGRGVVSAPLVVSLQVTQHVWLGLASGVVVPDSARWSTAQIALGAQLGTTLTGALGPVLEIVLDAGFPRLFVPGRSGDALDAQTFRALLSVRFYSYWDLLATLQPEPGPERPACASGVSP